MSYDLYDLIVIGGGPAGTAAAIRAARLGARVLLLERGRFPRHKVCGEFISAESLGLLASLLAGSGGEKLLQEAPRVSHLRIFSGGAVVEVDIAPAAASVSRYQLDEALWRGAEAAGAECRQQIAASAIEPAGDGFGVAAGGEIFATRTVIQASGRWSNLDPPGEVPPAGRWVGIKAHFAGDDGIAPSVDLYFFTAGYCGVQPVGEGRLNACAMVRAAALDRSGNTSLLEAVFDLDPRLHRRSRRWRQVTDSVTTSPLMFRAPEAAREGILRAGDAAGFIDPFAGDGISLALRSGAMAAETLQPVWTGSATAEEAARRYVTAYSREMLPVFRTATRLRRLLQMPSPLRRSALEVIRLAGLGRHLVQATRLPRQPNSTRAPAARFSA